MNTLTRIRSAFSRWSLVLISMTLVFSPHAEAAYRYSNLPPAISGSPPQEVVVGKTYEFTPVASDPEGRALVFSIFGRPKWATFDRYTGRLSGAPGVENVGTSGKIVIAVSDKRKMTYLPEFRITVRAAAVVPGTTNSAPQIAGVPSGTATAGLAYTFQPTASDSNGDPLTFSIANQPAWATFNRSTGLLSGVPTTAGTHPAISISVSDGTAVTFLPAFSIVVSASAQQNSAPTISGTPATSVAVGTAFSFQPAARDPDGNALGFSIANKPTWASFSTTTGRLSGTPVTAATHAGITISVSDGMATTSLPAFTLTVSAPPNRAPVISGTPATSVNAGGTYTFSPAASDADGNALTFSIANKPGWATFNAANGQLTGVPTAANIGTFSGISISVSDGVATTTLGSFAINVTQVSLGSATLSWTAPTQNSDGTALTNLSGYRIYYGTSSANLTQTISIDNIGVSTYVVENLSPATWYFAVKAVANSVESDLSNVASKVVN